MALSIDIETVGQVQIVHLVGDIDGATAPEAQAAIVGVAGPGCKIVLDMSGVSYISSAGLRALLMLYRQMAANDGRVALAGLTENIKDVMIVTGFLEFFDDYDTLEEGLAALHSY